MALILHNRQPKHGQFSSSHWIMRETTIITKKEKDDSMSVSCVCMYMCSFFSGPLDAGISWALSTWVALFSWTVWSWRLPRQNDVHPGQKRKGYVILNVENARMPSCKQDIPLRAAMDETLCTVQFYWVWKLLSYCIFCPTVVLTGSCNKRSIHHHSQVCTIFSVDELGAVF